MANQGFKGTKIHIDTLTLSNGPTGMPTLKVGIQFVSEDGIVHAVAQHAYVVDPEVSTDALPVALSEVLRLVTRRIERDHFDTPHDAKTEAFVGIAESIRSKTGASDEPGTQG